MAYSIDLVIRIICAAVFAAVMGSGSVVAFNRMPARWFEDYAEDGASPGTEGSAEGSGLRDEKILPPKLLEADAMGRQRLPSTPWKYAFTGYFGICGIWLSVRGGSMAFEISVLCVLFVVLEMAVCDQLYQVVPDQLSWALAAAAVAFIGYYDKWWEQGAGCLLGLGISLAILLLGSLLSGTGSIGGADIKFFACIGLVAGRSGVIIIFILTTLLFAAYSVIKIIAAGGSIKDRNAMLPSACAAVTIYFLFLRNAPELLVPDL